MSLIAKKTGGSKPVPAGTTQGICIAVVDLGTQYSRYYDKSARKVLITWEVPEHRIEIDKEDLPRVISKIYTLSLHKKAQLLADLQSWRGIAFTKEELDGFDVCKIIGQNCYLSIIHATKDNDTYANIASISKLPKNIKSIESESKHVVYSMVADGLVLPEDVPEWVTDKIKESEEFKASENAAGNEDLQAAQEQYSEPAPTDDDIPEDVIPF